MGSSSEAILAEIRLSVFALASASCVGSTRLILHWLSLPVELSQKKVELLLLRIRIVAPSPNNMFVIPLFLLFIRGKKPYFELLHLRTQSTFKSPKLTTCIFSLTLQQSEPLEISPINLFCLFRMTVV